MKNVQIIIFLILLLITPFQYIFMTGNSL